MSERIDRRGRGWTIGAGGTAILVVALFVSNGAASAGLPPGSSWSPSGYRYFGGCSNSRMGGPTFSVTTGVGHFAARGASNSCPSWRGGPSTASYAEITGALYVTEPVRLVSTAHGVNVSWSLVGRGAQSSSAGSSGSCPTSTYVYDYNYGYTWYNITYVTSYCYVVSEIAAYSYTYLFDNTSGSYTYGTSWSGLLNETTIYNSTTSYVASYSNPSYWKYNYSYLSVSSGTTGGAGSFVWNLLPTVYVNGTFSASHHYRVESYVYLDLIAETAGYSGAHAGAHLDFATNGAHIGFGPVVVW